jgi:PAS domain S-box-containing protein
MTQLLPIGVKSGRARLDGPRVAELEARLREAEETIEAIRNGDVDAVVVDGPAGHQVYTLENADRPYRVLIEQMQEGAVTMSNDGTVLYCNQRFAAIVGTRRESIIGGPVCRYFSDDEYEVFQRLLSHRSDDGAAGEFTLRASGDVRVPVNISLIELKADGGMSRVVCGVITDLTQNRRRGNELTAANDRLAVEIEERSRAEESLRLALGAAGMGSWDLELATDAARRSLRHDQIFGHSQMLPNWSLQAALAHFVSEDREAVADAFAQARTSGSIEFELRIIRADDGAIRWIHLKGQTYYKSGTPVRIAGVVADVTDQRAVEEQLRQAQKMEALGQLTGGIAHDFNNLLMIIGGSLDLLSRRIPKDERTARLIEAARQGVSRGSKLNQQLLAFARRQELRTEVVCIDELIPSFKDLLDRAVSETITVKFELMPQTWLCRTDPHQLETAILNLAINARDAMPQGGTLTLSTMNRTVTEQNAVNWGASQGDYAVVSVADTGIGMLPDVVSRVFEPFFTTKALGKGTGLGLSQVYGFAKQSDGFVTIESEPGAGTTVGIYLPRTDQPKAAAPIVVLASAEIEGQGIVLVVEDDLEVRATTTEMLRDLGYTVREANSSRAALILLESGEVFDLVLSDIIMPDGMSGIELARKVLAMRPDLPVLLTSGYTGQGIIPSGLVDELPLLRKPYAQAELSQAISEVMIGGHRPAEH